MVVVGEDEVVDERKVDRFGGAGELAGGVAVRGAWGGVAAGVVVRQEDPGTAEPRGIGDDVAHGEFDRALIALRIAGEVDAARLVVDVSNPQRFGGGRVRAVETGRKEVLRGVMAGKQSR